MNRFWRGSAACVWLGVCPAWGMPAVVSSTAPAVTPSETVPTGEPPEPEQPFSADEGDAKTADLLTPTSAYPVKKPYDQARELLQKSADLWKQGRAQAASDLALEAYDDLLEIHFPRKQKKARKKLRAERHQAATVYIQSSVAYIKEEADRARLSPAAKDEARARLGDLHDVSREYPELQQLVIDTVRAFQ